MARMTRWEFDSLADGDGSIVAYPDGLNNEWNDGRAEKASKTKMTDDAGFLSALIDTLVRLCNADPERIYFTGMSNGAMMCFRMAAQFSDRITAIAPIAGSIPVNVAREYTPSQPVSVIAFNGTKDNLVPYNGGDVTGPAGMRKFGKVLPINDAVAFWAEIDGCTVPPSRTDEPDADPGDGTRVKKLEYTGGRNKTDVVLYTIDGGGHTWPGGNQYLPQWIVGKTSRDIDACTLLWAFFENHGMVKH